MEPRWNLPARLLFLAALAAAVGCGPDRETTVDPPVALRVQQTSLVLPGAVAPSNPVAEIGTPSELNAARAQVYQEEGRADGRVGQVLVLMPGFLGGAGNFDYLARRLVERSGGQVAVWALDRRSNGLEDHAGLDAAERERNPDLAKAYYFGGAEAEGRRFEGFLGPDRLRFVSEWGIRVHVEDLDAVISEVRRRYPAAPVFLGGHSLGASIVPIYAAWDFGTHAGFERLSGIVLLEGAPNPGGTVPSRQAYETQGVGGGFGRVSLRTVRTSAPVSSLQPFAGTDLYVTAEILAMRVHSDFGAAADLSADADLYGGFFSLLLGLPTPPAMTNRAAFGFGFDDDFQPLAFARVSMGSGTGGEIGANPNAPFLQSLLGATGDLQAPIDPLASYDWQSTSATDPFRPDPTRMEDFAAMMFRGPSNFIEWYFPARLSLDVGLVNQLDVASEGDWRKEAYGLAVTENARVDVPVLAVGGSRGLVPDLRRFDPYEASLAPVLRNGTARSASTAGFARRMMEGHVHLDVLSAEDREGEGNGLFGPLLDWMQEAAVLAPR